MRASEWKVQSVDLNAVVPPRFGRPTAVRCIGGIGRSLLRVARTGLGLGLVALAGCKGTGTAGLDQEPPKPGSVLVSVAGLPSGGPAALVLSGPVGYSRSITESGPIANLPPGTYTLAAADVVVDGDGYAVAPVTQDVVVRSSATAPVGATYAILTGRLLLSIDGVAAGTADVLVTGPTGFSRTVTGADTVKGLPNGTYVVRPRPVTIAGDRYGSPVDSSFVLVTPGTVPSPASVQYQLASGRLDLSITGVPAGATPMIALDGPSGFSLAATGPQLLKGLLPGPYSLHGAVINSDGDLYEADIVPSTVQVTPTPVALSAVATYQIKTGALTVNLTGLPSGVLGNVTVTGPGGFSDQVTADRTLRGLAPGTYTLAAAPVAVGASSYQGQPVSQTVAVTAGKQPVVRSVAYSLGVGSLRVTIAGVPSGSVAAVSVNGPNGFSQNLTVTTTLSGLAPGSYVIGAAGLVAGGYTYGATPASQAAVVSINATTNATVTYAATTGSLAIGVNGLPGGAPAAVTVTGPGSFNQSVTAGTTVAGLAPGTYTVAAASVSSGGTTYNPSPTSQAAVITAGATATATVNYAGNSGNLAVTVTGLPGGATAAVIVTGPGGFHQSVTATQTLTGLTAGSYTIAAANVTSGGIVYLAGPVSQSASVTVGATTPAPVTYTATGTLTVTITGLPGGNPAAVTVTGPGGFNRAVTATQSLTGLTAGTYTVAAANVPVGGTTYLGAPTTQAATVTAGVITTKTVTYTATGSLTVTVTGLPGGATAAITVTGPGGYNQSVTGTTTLPTLAAGSYTIAAGNTSSGGNSYNPAPTSQSATVTGGATASATVTYTIGAPVPLNLVIDGMYLTQAAAKYDGSTPVIASRDGYLRVFVKANQANTATPTVRVRLYSGASLIQTSTITASAASVPTTITEGTFTSSWNLLIPAATLQPNLRVLADVDPTNAVVESSDADNTFPVTGTPFVLDVRAVPTWNVRFVPVLQSVNSLQGNVTVGNAGTFLVDPLKLLPVAAYSADVRAVYTTSAPVLESGNGNGAWGTILSEVAALRSADASSRYYYGVVKTSYDDGVVGIGYVGGGIQTALGWDALPSGSGIMAHEVGHNMGRWHSPCGGAGRPDPAYPYAGGIIGTYGLDLTTLAVKGPTTNFDFMGYCSPNWVSDYTWSGLITYRQAAPNNAPPAPSSAVSGLLVWGRVGPLGVVLEPAFRVAPPATPSAAGSSGYRVEGLAANGRVLFSHPVQLEHTMTINTEHEEHFVAVIPLDQAQDDGLAQLRLVTPAGPVNRLSPQAIVQAGGRLFLRNPGAAMTSPAAVQATITWDVATYPMAMVRDAATGEILSFARSGATTIWTRSRQFDVTFSDGVRSTIHRVALP